MGSIRSRNGAFLLRLEDAEGVFQAPNASTDGILVERPTISFSPQNTDTDEVTGSLDGRGPIVGGIQVQIGFDFYVKGSGVPGVSAEWNDVMKISGWAETVTSTSITGTTFAADAGGNITDSGNGLAALTVGTPIHVSGFANPANNGEFLVTTSAAGTITVTKADGSAHGLAAETAGASVTIRRGIAAVAATAGTTTSATLQAPWSGTDQLYRGMPVLLSGNPAAPAYAFLSDYTSGRVATLTDLMGSALNTSTKAGIPPNIVYAPASVNIPSGSGEMYMDGVRWRFRGMRGTISFTFQAGGAIRATVRLSGLFEGNGDAAVPAVPYDGTRPGTFRNSRMLMDRARAALASWTIDAANTLTYPADPNDPEGFDVPIITRRRMSGRLDPKMTVPSVRDLLTKFRTGAEQIIHGRVLGSNARSPGQRIGMTVPAAFFESYAPGDRDGLATEEVGYFARGQDSGAFLTLW